LPQINKKGRKGGSEGECEKERERGKKEGKRKKERKKERREEGKSVRKKERKREEGRKEGKKEAFWRIVYTYQFFNLALKMHKEKPFSFLSSAYFLSGASLPSFCKMACCEG
jgi:hypothetical protein